MAEDGVHAAAMGSERSGRPFECGAPLKQHGPAPEGSVGELWRSQEGASNMLLPPLRQVKPTAPVPLALVLTILLVHAPGGRGGLP